MREKPTVLRHGNARLRVQRLGVSSKPRSIEVECLQHSGAGFWGVTKMRLHAAINQAIGVVQGGQLSISLGWGGSA